MARPSVSSAIERSVFVDALSMLASCCGPTLSSMSNSLVARPRGSSV
jgi:hypothetical protein